jgi:hypothetical protein
MQFMVIERFHDGNPVPVYTRFQAEGRLSPEGLFYISSWVSEDLTTCYQLMEAERREQLDEWMSHWQDLVDFEIVPVITSTEAYQRVLGGSSQPRKSDR